MQSCLQVEPFSVFKTGLHWGLIKIVWLASELQGSSSGMMSAHLHVQLFMWVLGITVRSLLAQQGLY